MKIIKPLIITLSTLIVVLVIVALITPPIAKNYINKHGKELIGRQVRLNGLYLNIFTGYTRLTDFRLFEANGQDSFVAFDTLTIDISLFRLLANELRINQIHLINPDLRILQKGTDFNFSDLLTPAQADTTQTSAPLPEPTASSTEENPSDTLSSARSAEPGQDNMAIAIYDIAIRGGHIYYEDQNRHSVWKMENFGLDIPGVYFSGKNTDVGLALNFNDGGHLQTHMQYNMEAGDYLLSIDLSNFSISPIRPYLTDFMHIRSIQGLLSAQLAIEGNVSQLTDLSVKGQMGLRSLSLTGEENHEVFAIDSVFVDMENIAPGKPAFYFNTIAVNGIRTTFDMYKDGNTFTRLLKESPADTLPQAETLPAAQTDTLTAAAAPDLKINTFRIGASEFAFNDYTLHQPFHFKLENISLQADHLAWNQKNKAKINGTLSNGGTITFDYAGKPDDLSQTDLLLSIKNLDLKTFTPYSLQYFGYPLTQGILSFSSINNISDNILDGRNNLSIARCEAGQKQKAPKPEYNIPLRTALYLIKDRNDQIKMNLPVSGNIDSPEFSYKKIIFKTLTNLLIKVAVSPVGFLANSLGFSPDKLKNLDFEATQNDFTPDQLTRINQLAEIIKAKPEMTLIMEQFVNQKQSQGELAHFYVKRKYYLSRHPEKTQETLLPIDYTRIIETDTKDIQFLSYVSNEVRPELKTAYVDDQILSLADSAQLCQLTQLLTEKRNGLLKNYLLRQGVDEKNIRISTAPAEKGETYTGKNQYTIRLIFEGDEPDPELLQTKESGEMANQAAN